MKAGQVLPYTILFENKAEATAPAQFVRVTQQLDADLLVAGAVLHDIGKLRELSFARSFRYTDLGQLVGHIALGITWVEEKSRKIPGFPPALLAHIQHIIASHHGLPEHGAVKPPMTPEAMAFHLLDDLDAKLASLDTIRKAEKLGGGYLFEPDEEELLKVLLPKHIEVQTFHALMESAAAELGARMAAMDGATRNAGELIQKLTLFYNKTRQAAITKELMDIVGGAEALK